MVDADVLVVGAGPAGAAAALELARAGRHIVVVDQARFPRDKCCGDGLTTAALGHLEHLGVDPRGLPSATEVSTAVLHTPAGRTKVLPLPRGRGTYALVVPRLELDALLVAAVEAAGIDLRLASPLTALAVDGDRVVASAGGSTVRAGFVVAADGMWSPTRRLASATPDGGGRRASADLGEWHALRQYLTDVRLPPDELHVWFEPDLLPGYAWAFPLAGGRANVGLGVLRRDRRRTGDLTRRWREVLERPHVRSVIGDDARPESGVRAWPIPTAIGRRPLSALGGRVLFTGDAAGAGDALTGEGIGQALQTGRLAAEAILDTGLDEPQVTADRYRAAVAAELGADDRMARVVAGLVTHRPLAEGVLALAGATPWIRGQVARWMFEGYPRAYLATPRRWHQHSMTGPGAWAP